MHRVRQFVGRSSLVLGIGLLPAAAHASAAAPEAEGSASGSASASLGGGSTSTETSAETSGDASASADTDKPLMRHRPRAQTVDFALYGGLFFPPSRHNLLGSGATFKRLDNVMGSLGLRIAYFPLRWFGAEIEGGGFPGSIDGGDYVQLYHVRGHAIFQLPWRLSAFALFGPGVFMVSSPRSALGTDPDPVVEVGAGGRFWVNDVLHLRLEWRGSLSGRRPSFYNEVLLSLGVTFGPKAKEAAPPPPPPRDSDGDGFLDPIDKCPQEVGVSPAGCPDPDRDHDGIANEVDKCPDEVGVEPDGCPQKDTDRDGWFDEDDTCPEEPGVAPDGCPIKDADGDGILDVDDKCPDKPEVRNGFDDTDGCPDEIPKDVEKFTGVIKGIYFNSNKATIQKRSHRVLDEAVSVLEKYPSIKVEIVGHTDATGTEEHNRELSQKRADAVRQYLVDKGIGADRLMARGAGEAEPIADNRTAAGRAENRRTEFNIVSE